MNLVAAFAEVVARNPRKQALFWGESEYSYQELLDQSGRLAAHLTNHFGIKPGDRIGIWLKNRPEFITTVFGILRTGAVAVPINNFLKPNEVAFILNDCTADLIITEETMAAALPEIKTARPALKSLVVEEFAALKDQPAAVPHARGENDLAVIIYTSGTTGKPKGAMLSHGNLLHNAESCRLALQVRDADRLALLLPMFHSFMLMVGILLPLLSGASIVLIRSLHPPRNVLQEIIARKATLMPAIPQFFRSMLSSQIDVPLPLRLAVSGAAPLPVQVLKEFERKFGFPIIEGYGLSEASPVVSKNPLDGRHKAGSIGLPLPNVEVSIQDDLGKLLVPGEIGEVCVRGGNVMLGYWNQPAETAKVMRNGWLLTGDIGYRDAEGFFFITDRKKDMLLVNGINVYPREVEEVIYQFPGIKEASVIGVPDARRGEQPLAFVAVDAGMSVEERALLQFVRGKLADYKVPKRVVFLEALPRNATGKILKTSLRELASKGEAAVTAAPV